MKKEIGDKYFPIWLIGDSNPKNWSSILKFPFDSRHPARHNIWTPLAYVIQDCIYRKTKKRVDFSKLYIRNAIENPIIKPERNSVDWLPEINKKITELQNLMKIYRPRIVISFGSFSYEFCRRCNNEKIIRAYNFWNAKTLGLEFRQRIELFDPQNINLMPLLHRSISGGKFIASHNYFTNIESANYFDFAGQKIAKLIINQFEDIDIWI